MSKAKAALAEAARLAPERRDDPEWREGFLAALAETSNVRAAARMVNVDPGKVYKLRRSDSGFAADWQAALAEGYDNLEMELLRRLREGDLEGGSKTKARRKFDNAVALRLLAAHRETVGRVKAIRANEDEEAILASIDAKLETMRRRDRAARLLQAQDGVTQPGGKTNEDLHGGD
ncbi:MAG: hypothetical protein ABJM58_13200 [Alteripontixanthobacter sp.]